MRKHLIITLLMLFGVMTASAATKQEMEQARALAAKWGVRSQNSGSGYLDGTNPKNLDQVRASVKSHKTDNDNLGKMSLPMPSEEEYQSWDNAKMTSYWLSQYNSSVPAGGDKDFCRSKLKSALSSVPTTVTKAPEPKEPAAVETPANEAPTETENKTETVAVADTIEIAPEEALATDIVDAAAADPEVEPLAAPGTNGEREAAKGSTELSGGGSNVWVIVMLVMLVLVVLALVGYASNLMARNNKRNQGNPRRQKANKEVAEDDDDAEEEDDDDDDSIMATHVTRGGSRAAENAATTGAAAAMGVQRQNPTHRPAPRISQPRIIYLSNANSEGVFLRADAQYNMGNSIFKLITSDGYSGTFSVIDDPNVYEMALMMPVDFLINACSGRNLQLSQGARGIVTDSTGTAVFEDGRWRVARKAQIHYTR